jgi:hypothetical protein
MGNRASKRGQDTGAKAKVKPKAKPERGILLKKLGLPSGPSRYNFEATQGIHHGSEPASPESAPEVRSPRRPAPPRPIPLSPTPASRSGFYSRRVASSPPPPRSFDELS